MKSDSRPAADEPRPASGADGSAPGGGGDAPGVAAETRPSQMLGLGPGPRRNLRIAALVLFAAALLVSRFARIGDRPLHHDESIHAFQSLQLAKDGTWRYDPAYHGPFLYYANALVYKVAGVTNTTARFLPAVFGVALVLFAIPIAAWFGWEAAVAYALLVLISPHLAYFSRFIREDLYSLVFTFGTIFAFRRFLETDRARWLTLSAVAFAFAGVTKENAYMTGVLFVVFGLWSFAAKALAPKGGGVSGAFRATVDWVRPRWQPIVVAGVVFLSIWAVFYTAFGRYPSDWLAIPKAVRYWMGQHTIARIPGPWYYYFPQLAMYETATIVAALVLLRRREVRRDRFIQSAACVGAGLFFGALLSSLLAVKLPGLAKWGSLGVMVAGVVGGLLLLRNASEKSERASPFLRFLVFWTIASLAIYGWAREKVPWLTVHPLLPLTILAAIALADLWRQRRSAGPRLALLGFALLAAVNASGMYLACFRYGAHDLAREPGHAEMLAYVQSTRDLVRALEYVDKAKARIGADQNVITVTGEASWPLTWYLRDVKTNWATRVDEATTPVIVADWDVNGGLEKQLADKYRAIRVPIRAWWFPGKIAGEGGKPARPTVGDLFSYWIAHTIWSPIGSQDATFFVRKELDASGSEPLEPLRLTLHDSTARDYNGEASVVAPVKTWGSFGSGSGQMSEPRGVAVDARGTLYVADTKNSRILVFDGAGQLVRQFGGEGKGLTEFKEPCGVAVDSQGDLWVADTWNNRIVHYSPEGQPVGAIGAPDNLFFGPRAVVVSNKSFVYVADTGNKKIVRFDRDGKRLNEFGGDGSGPGEFVEPVGLAADASGNVHVADTGNHRIQVFDPEGKFLRQYPVPGWKDFYTEPYLAIGPGDILLVTDSWGGRVNAFDPRGVLRRSWKADADFKQPTGIAIDPFGRVIVTDRGTHRIFTWSLAGVLP